MPSPLDDPEIRRMMAEAGVAYKPGLAAEMLRDMAPLLAAEGIDLDGPIDMSIDEINAALARATERHNLELSTPVGAQRDNAFGVLRAVAESVIAGNDALANTLLTTVEPESFTDAPSVAHVTGVAVGLLDDWYRDHASLRAKASLRLPPWPKIARSVATDILALAKKGRAFDSLQSLITRHGGRAVLWGAALAVAVVARERHSREGLALDVLLPGGRAPVRSASTAAFTEWLESVDEPDPDGEVALFESLRSRARAMGLDLDDPDGMAEFVTAVMDDEVDLSDDVTPSALMALRDYVAFRIDEGDRADAWELVAETFDGAEGDLSEFLDAAVQSTNDLDVETRLAAVRAAGPVAAVPSLLEWLGDGRPVTSTGGVRLADIETVAGMLGIRAIGVSKRPSADVTTDALYVRSMGELPLLDAWWQALMVADVIQVSVTRVKPGAAAAIWSEGSGVPLEFGEMLIGLFVGQLLAFPIAQWIDGMAFATAVVVDLLSADAGGPAVTYPALALALKRQLHDAGILVDGPDGPQLPVALHATVAHALVLARAIVPLDPED